MNEELPTMAELSIRGVPLAECSYVEISDRVRLYYLAETTHSFDFCAVQWAWGETLDFFAPDARMERLFQGIAYHDGVRHFYLGSENTDNFGYLHYPDLPVLIRVLEELKNLEEKHCHHC